MRNLMGPVQQPGRFGTALESSLLTLFLFIWLLISSCLLCIRLWLGAFLGGWIVSKLGVLRALLVCGIVQMLSNLAFVAQAYAGYNLSLLVVTIAVENITGGMGTAALVAYLSKL